MITAFTAYIKTITALTIFSALTELLLPDGRQRRYAQLILGIFILTAVLHPFLQLMGKAEVPVMQTRQESPLKWKEWENWEWLDTYKYTNEG